MKVIEAPEMTGVSRPDKMWKILATRGDDQHCEMRAVAVGAIVALTS